jgi:hypothetical protein
LPDDIFIFEILVRRVDDTCRRCEPQPAPLSAAIQHPAQNAVALGFQLGQKLRVPALGGIVTSKGTR